MENGRATVQMKGDWKDDWNRNGNGWSWARSEEDKASALCRRPRLKTSGGLSLKLKQLSNVKPRWKQRKVQKSGLRTAASAEALRQPSKKESDEMPARE